jgi:hypothetical protein
MSLAEDRPAVQDLVAQGADEALADRVHARSLHGGAQDPGPVAWKAASNEYVKSAVADQELDVPGPLVRARARLRACCIVHSPLGCAVTPRTWTCRVDASITNST